MNLVKRVLDTFETISAEDFASVWLSYFPKEHLVACAREIEEALSNGHDLPLAGKLVAVKDNIDVAGLPTTAACPAYSYLPQLSAPAVQALVSQGAIIVGKTNLDQFATGLVGTRSPYGVVEHADLPGKISGGSSSGSAVAVALDQVDLALGTDTAGSGRIPAAFHGIYGIKTTVGVISTKGVVPACPSFDVVTVFAKDLKLATQASAIMIAGAPDRNIPADVPLALRNDFVVGVPAGEDSVALDATWRRQFQECIARVKSYGAKVVEVALKDFLDAAKLLYEGAFIAERYSSVGEFIDGQSLALDQAGLDPTVAKIISSGREVSGAEYVRDLGRLKELRRCATRVFGEVDLILTPTTTHHPTIAQVRTDPIGVNARLGTFTNFVNLLDLSAVAFPGGKVGDENFGLTALGPSFGDQKLIDFASWFGNEGRRLAGESIYSIGIKLAVFGAHMRGFALNHELQKIGARYLMTTKTLNDYRMVALDVYPPKPGVVKVGGGLGVSLECEIWSLAPAALGKFLAQLPEPMLLGRVQTQFGVAVGFSCTQEAALNGSDISHYGGWRNYHRHLPRTT